MPKLRRFIRVVAMPSVVSVLAAMLVACGGDIASKATPVASTPTATASSVAVTAPATREVELVKSVRPAIDAITVALKKNDLAASKAAYEKYDALWNGIEVYINYRSRDLYGQLETDLQAKLADGLNAKTADLTSLIPASEALGRKYDEAIALVQKGPALSPLFDDLATLRIVRSDLRIVTAALVADDLAKAKVSFATLQSNYPKAQPLIKQRSTAAESEAADALAAADADFKAPGATVDKMKPLVATLTSRYNYGVSLLNAAARNAEVDKKTYTESDVATLSALNAVTLSLQKSQAAWTAGTYAVAGDTAKAASGAQFDNVKPALQPKAADAALKTALDNYANLASGAADAANVNAAYKAALEAITIAQQVVAGQFWTDTRLQGALAGLPKS